MKIILTAYEHPCAEEVDPQHDKLTRTTLSFPFATKLLEVVICPFCKKEVKKNLVSLGTYIETVPVNAEDVNAA